MTVSTATSRSGPYAGAGTTGPFTVNFRFLDAAHLEVIRTDTTGEHVLVLSTDYSVSGVGNPTGSVTLLAALPVGQTLTIIRAVPVTQEADYVQNDDFPAQSHEDVLDKLTMIAQQHDETIGRSLTLPASAPSGVSTKLPVPESNRLLGWNQAANGLQNIDATTLVSIAAFGTAKADLFSGTGVQTAFTLTGNPGAQANLDVAIGGVTQRPNIDYTWNSGTTLIFAVAPPIGTNNVLARYLQALPQGVSDSAASQFVQAGTGATSRTAQNKMRERVSPEDFGAIGGGVADDTSALTAAINYVKGTNRRLILSGVYKFTAPLLLDAACSIEGEFNGVANSGEQKGAVLYKVGNFVGVEITSNGCALRNLTIDSAGGSDTKQGLKITAGGRTRIEDVAVTRQGSHGIEFNDGNLSSFRDVRLIGNAGDGMKVIGVAVPNTNACTFENIDARSNGGYGVNFDSCWNAFAPAISAQQNALSGIRLNNCRQSHLVLYSENNLGVADIELTNHANCNGNMIWAQFISNMIVNNSTVDTNTIFSTINARGAFDSIRFDRLMTNNGSIAGQMQIKHTATARHDVYMQNTGQPQTLRFKNTAGLANIDNDTAIYPVLLDYQATYPVRPRLIFPDGSVNPSVILGDFFLANNSGPTTITALFGGTVGQIVHIVFNNGNTTITNSTTSTGIRLKGNANKTFAQYDGITLICNGAGWFIEV